MRKKFIYVLWALVACVILAIAFIFTAIAKGWIGYVPPIEELENPNLKFATEIISDDGKMLGTWSISKENRVFVGYDQLSPNLIHALIATEDERFSEHSGIDARAFIRALVKRGILMQKNAGGGSTITQQLAKQFYSPTADNVMERLLQKPIEWVIAVQLERYYTKEEILTMYLNKFDFLNNAVGIKTAANTYFSKEPKDLKTEMADEAKEAAQATIKAYCDAIRSMTGEAGSAAEAVANAAASHLKTAPTTTPTATTVTGHANGTLSAQEDVYIAGEKGPELIIGARGSEVFPTQETERILAAVNSAENATNAPEPELPTDVPATPFAAAALPEPTASPLPENDLPEGMEAVKEYSHLTADGQGSDAQPTGIEYVEPEVQAQTTEEATPAEEVPVNTTAPAASDAQQEAPAATSDAPSIGETVKRIIIEINGSGSIDVGGMNEESVLDILTRHAKPVLMSIIKGEIFEEGDLAYDF